ncbi:hypothetical protein BDF21DRAFT_433387 [Thamnidium elegans]|nr:hypothetical protein BDF21DRAFT_433387 [Thamnidium elegans]
MTPPAGSKESDTILTKRVEVILTINQELIRLCLEHQQMNMNETREPDITIYKSRLQSNLTYLATMADISMTKPEENTKIPTPPNLSPLPPPHTMTGQRIHKLLFSANRLFMNEEETEMMSPYPQQQGYNKTMMMRQRQQQYSSGMNSVGSSNSSNSNYNMLSPHHLHHPLLKNNQNNVDIVQDTGNYTMDDTAMMMMMMYSLPQV